jgi:hypothetical protein
MQRILSSSLYEQIVELRIGVLSDNCEFEDDIRFHDPKIIIVYKGSSEEYERPTLLHIKAHAASDPPDTLYFYIHTKGLRHFGTERESNVLDWINLMLYWNIERWQTAVAIVSQDRYWTYGCNYTGVHYSGNFWWSKQSHIAARLSDFIPYYYSAPEDWVTMLYWGKIEIPRHIEFYSVFNSGLEGTGHYYSPYPESNYRVLS